MLASESRIQTNYAHGLSSVIKLNCTFLDRPQFDQDTHGYELYKKLYSFKFMPLKAIVSLRLCNAQSTNRSLIASINKLLLVTQMSGHRDDKCLIGLVCIIKIPNVKQRLRTYYIVIFDFSHLYPTDAYKKGNGKFFSYGNN